MTQDTRIRFIIIVVLTAVCALVVAPMENKPFFKDYVIRPGIDLAGGAELRYRIVYESTAKGNEKKLTEDAAEIIRKRLDAKQLKEAKINTEGDDRIVVQIPGVDRAGLQSFKNLIGIGGKLELFAVAPKEIQEQYVASKTVPTGYRAIENTSEARHTGEYAAYSPVMLLRTPEVITGRKPTDYDPRDLSARESTNVIKAALDRNEPVSCATLADEDMTPALKKIYDKYGIHANHSYTFYKVDPKSQKVYLRNPWGGSDAVVMEMPMSAFKKCFDTLSVNKKRRGR